MLSYLRIFPALPYFRRIKRKLFALGVGFLCLLLLLPAHAFAIRSPFFSVSESGYTDLSAFTKWTPVLPRYQQQRVNAMRECDLEQCLPKRWESLLSSLQDKSALEKMQAVNTFFNAITYVEDAHNFGVQDYWQTPYEMMKNGGDCEDYAIGKYISLKRLGISESAMRIVIVQDNNLGGVMHAVLEVRHHGKRYVLDNQVPAVTNQASIFHYRPIFAINSQQWWAYQ